MGYENINNYFNKSKSVAKKCNGLLFEWKYLIRLQSNWDKSEREVSTRSSLQPVIRVNYYFPARHRHGRWRRVHRPPPRYGIMLVPGNDHQSKLNHGWWRKTLLSWNSIYVQTRCYFGRHVGMSLHSMLCINRSTLISDANALHKYCSALICTVCID